MPSNPFEYANGMRDKITAKESQEIQQMYVELGKKIDALGKKYGKKDTASAPLQQMYYTQLKKQVEAWSKELSNGVYSKVTHAIGSVSDAVVEDNAKWLESLGFNKGHISAAFSNVNQSVVNSIVTGKIYGGKSGSWSLSKSIWGDNEKNLKTIYRIVAEGMTMQMGVQEIAENLRDFVDPTKKLDWTGPDGIKIYGRKTDYNAQRLVRTLSQHAYQKSVSQVAWDNPFISKIKWIANGSRVCEICKKRNGKVYALSKLPLDHPNGMCVMEPVIDDDITDQLADWVNGKETKKTKGIDKFADLLGYDKDELAKSLLKTPNKPKVKLKAKPKAEVAMQDMIEKYAKQLKQSTSDFTYLGKMSTDNFADSLYDDEIDDISKWMAKNFGLDVSTGSKKDKAVAKWIEEAFSKIDDMNYSEKDKLKSIANSIISSPSSSKKIDSIDDVLKTATKAVNKTTPKAVDNVVVKNATGNDKILGSLFDNFKSQTTKEMLSIEDKELSSLTKTQLKTLRRYTGSGYGEINDYLRKTANGGIYKGYLDKEDIDDIKDAVKAFSEITTKKDYALRRGTDANDIFYTFLNGNPSMREKINDLVDSVETDLFASQGESNLQEHIGEINSLIQGQIGSFSSFTSTSSDWDKGFNGIVEYVIDAPKGTAGTSVMSISHYGTSEGEFLLAPGTKVVCEKVEAASDGHKRAAVRVFLKIIV